MKENRCSRKEKIEDPMGGIAHSSKDLDSGKEHALPKSILKVSFRQTFTKRHLFYINYFFSQNTRQSLLVYVAGYQECSRLGFSFVQK